MKFDESPGAEPYDVQFVKWMTKEKVNKFYLIEPRVMMILS